MSVTRKQISRTYPCAKFGVTGDLLSLCPDCVSYLEDQAGLKRSFPDATPRLCKDKPKTVEDELRERIRGLLDDLDAAYDAHAGECMKCRIKWRHLRADRKARGE